MTDSVPDLDVNRLLWVLCRGLYAINNGREMDPAERLFLRVCEHRLASLLGQLSADWYPPPT